MSLLNTVNYWASKYDIEPVFILRRPLDKLAGAIDERGWKYYDLEYTFWSDAVAPVKDEDIFRSALRNGRAVKEIEGIINDEKPDLVMTNSVVCPWAALASYNQQKPHIWFVREYGDLDHGRVFEIGREQTFSDIGNLSDLVVTNSRTLAEHVSQYVGTDKLTTMYTPFSIDEITKKANETVASPFKHSDSLKVAITGSLTASKGQKEAVEAVGMLNSDGAKVELCIIGGNGPQEYRDELDELIDKYDIKDKIHFVGFQTNPLAYLRLADVGVMASRKEAFGRVTFEYLATGRAIVGANSGATPEMVIDGQTGYLYEQGDSESLVSALKHYVGNPELVKRHGQNASQKAAEMMQGEFNADALFERIQKVAASADDTDRQPIHFFHRWYDYMDTADKIMNQSGTFSIRRLIKMRLRQKTKSAYYRMRGLKAKLTGK